MCVVTPNHPSHPVANVDLVLTILIGHNTGYKGYGASLFDCQNLQRPAPPFWSPFLYCAALHGFVRSDSHISPRSALCSSARSVQAAREAGVSSMRFNFVRYGRSMCYVICIWTPLRLGGQLRPRRCCTTSQYRVDVFSALYGAAVPTRYTA